MLLAAKMERTTQFQIRFGGVSTRRMWEVRGNRNSFSKCTRLCKGGWCTCLAEVLLPTMGTSQQPLPPPQVLPRFAFDMSARLLREYGVLTSPGCLLAACPSLGTMYVQWGVTLELVCILTHEEGEYGKAAPYRGSSAVRQRSWAQLCAEHCAGPAENCTRQCRGKNTAEKEGSVSSLKLMMWPWAGPLEPQWSWIYLI